MGWSEVLDELADVRRPRDPRTSPLVRSAARSYRAMQALAALPLLMAAQAWHERGVQAGVIAFAVFGAFALAMAAYGESNVRAIRRLFRDGQLVWGSVVSSRPVRGGRQLEILFERDGTRGRVRVQASADAWPQVPILVVPDVSLVAVVLGDGQMSVGRSSRA